MQKISMEQNNNKTCVVGMSGGVDSSVSAFILKEQGYNVIGLHMKSENSETAKEDEARVVGLCKKLGIKLTVVEYASEMQKVKDYFVDEYLSGRTPNPCVVCNKEVKFKPFIEFAEKMNADFFATGHYANIEHNENGAVLKIAKDSNKDQTYFLCKLSAAQLEKALFPLGGLTKAEVKKIAEENGLVSKDTKESYDVCFLGSEKFKDFMSKNHPEREGNIVDQVSGKVVGKHSGISKYTLGQRKGLGIGGGHGESGDCWFVTKKNIKNNILYVAQGNDDLLYSDALESYDVNWIPFEPKVKEFDCFAKFRYRQVAQKVRVKIQDKKVCVEFYEKQRAITPGQFVVFYDDDRCLGGGTIDAVFKNGKILDL